MRFVFFTLICLLSFAGQAKTPRTRVKSPDGMAAIRRTLDMKVFRDRTFVHDMIKSIYDQDKSGKSSNPNVMNAMGHEGIFTKKDADIIRQESARKVVRKKLMETPWDEQAEAIEKDPFGAFIGLIEQQEVPDLTQEELARLNSVDKTVIPKLNQMMTESGPDVGASAVPVIYEGNIDLR